MVIIVQRKTLRRAVRYGIALQLILFVILISIFYFTKAKDRLCEDYVAKTGLLALKADFVVDSWKPIRLRLVINVYQKRDLKFKLADCIAIGRWFYQHMPFTHPYLDTICIYRDGIDSVYSPTKLFQLQNNEMFDVVRTSNRADSLYDVAEVLIPFLFQRDRNRYQFDTVEAVQYPTKERQLLLMAIVSHSKNFSDSRINADMHAFADSVSVFLRPMKLYDSIRVSWNKEGPMMYNVYSAKLR